MEPSMSLRGVPGVHSAGAWRAGFPLNDEPTDELEIVRLTPIDGIAVVTPSFESFYAASRDRVGRALALTLHDPELAADAVDEAMVRAYQHWEKVAHLDNPSGWAYRVALNYARSRIRRRRGREELLHSAADHDPPTVEPAIAAAVAQLPTRQRAVVVCRFVLGWSEAETARSLGIRPGTVKSRLHRALRALESELDHLRQEDHR